MFLRPLSALLFSLLLAAPQVASAHGLQLSGIVNASAVTGSVFFADGSPAVAISVEITLVDPSNLNSFRTKTLTDGDGRFAFPTPRREGNYQLTVDDGLGHRSTAYIEVPTPPLEGTADAVHFTEHSHAHGQWQKWLSGLGYLFGIFGAASWWLARRQRHRPGG